MVSCSLIVLGEGLHRDPGSSLGDVEQALSCCSDIPLTASSYYGTQWI